MFRRQSRKIAAVVMCFFTGALGVLGSIANADEGTASQVIVKAQPQLKAEGPEARYAKVLEGLRTALSDGNADVVNKKKHVSSGKAEIES